jgi:hypothetical protein
MREAVDKYPSRTHGKASLIPRVDPVVHTHASAGLLRHISAEQVAQYERDGFLVLHDVFSAEEVQCFKDELERLRNDPVLRDSDGVITEPGSGDVRSVFSVHTVSPIFKHLAADARLAEVAQGLLGDEVYIHQSRLNYKPGFRGKEFYWHSDFETWHVEDGMPSMHALSMSIALTENTPYNGALRCCDRLAKHDCLVCIISDGFGQDEETRRLLDRISRHNDVLFAFIFDPLEGQLPSAGKLVFGDGRRQLEVNTNDKELRSRFQTAFAQRRADGRKYLLQREMPVVPLSTTEDVAKQVRRLLGTRRR